MPSGSCVLFSCLTDSRCNPALSESLVLGLLGKTWPLLFRLNFTAPFQTLTNYADLHEKQLICQVVKL